MVTMSDRILADTFLGERAGWSGAPEALEEILAAHLAAGREAWPDAVLTEAAFIRHLARVLSADAGEEELRALRGADVYVACACVGGDEQAMRAFERRYFSEVDVAAARLRAPPQAAVEVKQMLRRILFVSEGKRGAAAGSFAGRGDLRGWIRVAAVRELQRILIREKRAVSLDDDEIFDVLSPAQDPELAYLRDLYRTGFAEAVRVAMAEAPAKERALLRYHVVDGLNIDEIGRLYDVHRATVARWLEKARAGILARTRDELTRRLGISPDEVDSIIRLVRSRLDVSMERVLAP